MSNIVHDSRPDLLWTCSLFTGSRFDLLVYETYILLKHISICSMYSFVTFLQSLINTGTEQTYEDCINVNALSGRYHCFVGRDLRHSGFVARPSRTQS